MRLTTLITALSLVLVPVAPALAQQGMFQTRAQVNDRIITNYEVSQRARFLAVLNTPGDLEALAFNALVEDRLRLYEAERLGLSATEEQVQQGMSEFAGRANMNTEQFIASLAGAGVAEQTFRDFVEAGIVWREVIRARYGRRINVTEADIDRALSTTSQRGAVRVLLSEIILPATPEYIDQTGPLAEELSQISGTGAFAEAARQYSAAQSREQGGQIDWLPLSNLPPDIGSMLLTMSPGEVTPPITLGSAIAVFQLRALEETTSLPPSSVAVEYAEFLIPGGQSPEALAEAARIRQGVDTCNDLNGFARGLPEEQLTFTTQTVPEVPQDVALELARLDPGESSASLVRGDALVFLMLCQRRVATEAPQSRDAVRERIINERLNGYSDILMDELRANAFIRTQ